MKDFFKKHFLFIGTIVRNLKIKKRYIDDYKNYKSNWMRSKQTINKVGYRILLEAHALEKGMTSKNPRSFGVKKVNVIMNCINTYEFNNWNKDFAYNLGVSILHEYCKFYNIHGWKDKEEYKEVKDFIKDKKQLILSGVKTMYKCEFIYATSIDYDLFLNSRHSIREFENKKIKSKDIIKAVEMALKTPTACNRQMCKIYYVKNDSVKNSILKYSYGLTNFNNDTINLFVITYDISSLCDPGEFNQGMFNSGLVSMNFINSLHSLGIGSCFLEFNDSYKEEIEYKKLLNIPKNEKVAIVIAAGYYPEETIVPCSTRKPIEEIYREI